MSTAAAAAAMLVLVLPPPAAAQSAGEIARLLAGGALALGVHEAGHVTMDLALGATPGLNGVRFGPLPFFAITHEPVTPGREFAISSAGFWTQHASSELILSRRPNLRQEHAPVLKGMLAFNVLASVAYAGAAFARTGPPERDTRGMAVSAGVPEPAIGALLLIPAVADGARYYKPKATWLVWVSRAAKVGGAVLIVRAIE